MLSRQTHRQRDALRTDETGRHPMNEGKKSRIAAAFLKRIEDPTFSDAVFVVFPPFLFFAAR
jgi:lipopolysaccharide/colanic/teichoic acid biosynthesis glycosyltransferase